MDEATLCRNTWPRLLFLPRLFHPTLANTPPHSMPFCGSWPHPCHRDPAGASPQVLEVHWRGDTLMGTIEILQTPSGLLLRELYSQGIKLGVSSRGWASLRSDPRHRCIYVDDDFELITFDFVTEPSTRGAFLIPVRGAYHEPIPNQDKLVQVAHLGHGVCGLEHVPKLPTPALLGARIAELQSEQAMHDKAVVAAAATGADPPPPLRRSQTRLSYLDKLLVYSHYVVLQDAKYLDRESHARDYASHLAMFATRAHLSNQAAYMSRADLNALIMREIAKEQATAAGGGAPLVGEGAGAIVAGAPSDLVLPPGAGAAGKASTRYLQGAGVECQATHRADYDAATSWHMRHGRGHAHGGDSAISHESEGMLPLPPAAAAPQLPPPAPAHHQQRPHGNRVAPTPGDVAASGRGVSPASDVAMEFSLIKGTLSRYAAEYSQRQDDLRVRLHTDLQASPVESISLAGAVH
eukprot:356225-Chlamydomonas_euryale.AAC.4